jgi:hypothetical protein
VEFPPQPETARAVTLRIRVDYQHLRVRDCQCRPEVYRRCGLSNTAFLVCNRNDARHIERSISQYCPARNVSRETFRSDFVKAVSVAKIYLAKGGALCYRVAPF